MGKNERVLSDAELISATFKAEAEGTMAELRAVERAVLAKLTEQGPVAWRVWLEELQIWSYSSTYHGCGEPLYAHPMPTGHIPDAGKMVAPHGYRLVSLADIDTAIQRASVFDDGGDGADPESARSCIEILKSMLKGDGTFIDEGTKEHHITTKNHIADMRKKAPEGWQLVQVEPDQALLVSMATCLNHGFGLLTKEKQDGQLYDMRKIYDEVVGRGYYSPKTRERYLAMLAAAPKYTGESK